MEQICAKQLREPELREEPTAIDVFDLPQPISP